MTFGEHLEVFRKMLFRVIGITVCLGVVIFCAKDTTFDLLLAPASNHFITYSVIEDAARAIGIEFHFDPYEIRLINTELSSQFMTHVSTSLYLSLLFVSPYIVVELYRYIAPALYENERRYSVSVAVAIFFLFVLGVLMSYYVLFPFFRNVSGGCRCGQSNKPLVLYLHFCYTNADDGFGVSVARAFFLFG